VRNLFYSDPKSLDLQKIRDEAEKRKEGDIRNTPVGTIIHFHKRGEACNMYKHEEFEVEEKNVSPTDEDEGAKA